MSTADLAKALNQIEDQMYEAARNLEFERAAQLRDQLQQLKHAQLASDD
jgi:excinuclease ABC subunit B